MNSAIALAAALLISAAAGSVFAVSCGSLGNVSLSGCLSCEPVTVNFTDRDGWHGKGRRLSQAATAHFGYGHKPGYGYKPGYGGDWPPPNATVTLPNCTACDTTSNFAPLPPVNSSHWSHPNISRCGCAAGYGTNVTGNATFSFGSKNKTIPTFDCVKCNETQVTLSPGSGVIPVHDKTTNTWSLVLISSIDRKNAGKYGLQYPASFHSVWGSKTTYGNRMGTTDGRRGHNSGWKKGPGFGPYFPGQCINCPANSTKSGSTCM